MSRPLRTGLTLAALLLSPHAVFGVVSLDFSTMGTTTTPALVFDDVTVTADNGTSAANVHMLNLNGMGVAGGIGDAVVDTSEALLFDFGPQGVPWVAYSVSVAGNVNGNATSGDTFVEAFDGNGASLGVVPRFDLGTHVVTHLFGCARISKFRVRANVDSVRIRSLTYRNDGEALSPACKTAQVVADADGSWTVAPAEVFAGNDPCFSPVSISDPSPVPVSLCPLPSVWRSVVLTVMDPFGNAGTCQADVQVSAPLPAADFTTLGSLTTSQLQVGPVVVTADNGASPATINVFNLNGLGVVGGFANNTVDSSEALRFDFVGIVPTAVGYRVSSAGNLNGNGTVGDAFVEAFDPVGNSLGVVAVDGAVCVDLGTLFGASQSYSAFRVRADADNHRISGVYYFLTTTTSTSTSSSTSSTTSSSTTSSSTTSSSTTSSSTTSSSTSSSSTSSSTSSSSTQSSSTTATTATVASTTTLPPGGCGVQNAEATFKSIACRLTALLDRVNAESGLGALQSKLAATLEKGTARASEAVDSCRSSNAKRTRVRLKQVIGALTEYRHRLQSRAARNQLDPALRAELSAAGEPLRTDAKKLRGALSCPGDAPPA